MRIAYEFPSANPIDIVVVRIVGPLRRDDQYFPMMWETIPDGDPDKRWFDFKYLNGRRIYGLNRPAVFERNDLRDLFRVYCDKAGLNAFP